MIVVKKGYSSLEQYSVDGILGPWTDIYALCSTIYRCITGETLPEAIQLIDKKKTPPSQIGIKIPAKAEGALLKGLENNYTQRTKDIQKLIDAFGGANHREGSIAYFDNENEKCNNTTLKESKLKYFVFAGVAAAVMLATSATMKSVGFFSKPPAPTATPMPTATATPGPTPTLTPSPTPTPTLTATPTPSPTPSPTATPEPTATPTPEPTATPTPEPTPTRAAIPTAAPKPKPKPGYRNYKNWNKYLPLIPLRKKLEHETDY